MAAFAQRHIPSQKHLFTPLLAVVRLQNACAQMLDDAVVILRRAQGPMRLVVVHILRVCLGLKRTLGANKATPGPRVGNSGGRTGGLMMMLDWLAVDLNNEGIVTR